MAGHRFSPPPAARPPSLLRGASIAVAAVVGLLLAAAPATAQLQVGMKISRRLFVAYEPAVATITITNRAGRDLELRDGPGRPWFGFQIATADGRLIPPRNLEYSLSPLTVPSGQTVKRSVNLTSLYPITEFGFYRVRAAVYAVDFDRYFSSPPDSIEISDGKVMWQQTVGVPEGSPGAGTTRLYSLLTFRQPADNMLYVRVEDRERGIVYATFPLARVLSQNEPQVLLDRDNQLHVLQVVGPKIFVHSQVGLNGELIEKKTYGQTRTRPHLARSESGQVQVTGGQVEVKPDAAERAAMPKLSDRPPNLPEF